MKDREVFIKSVVNLMLAYRAVYVESCGVLRGRLRVYGVRGV